MSTKVYRYRGKRTLGWVPLKGRELKREGSAFRFAGNTFRVFNSRALPDGKIKDGTCFARDAQGNWFLNVVIEVADAPVRPIRNGVGIAGLGIREWVCSDCGAMHDRDVNAALNILRRGRATLAVGILHLWGGEDVISSPKIDIARQRRINCI